MYIQKHLLAVEIRLVLAIYLELSHYPAVKTIGQTSPCKLLSFLSNKLLTYSCGGQVYNIEQAILLKEQHILLSIKVKIDKAKNKYPKNLFVLFNAVLPLFKILVILCHFGVSENFILRNRYNTDTIPKQKYIFTKLITILSFQKSCLIWGSSFITETEEWHKN